jgi:hypothetical protein
MLNRLHPSLAAMASALLVAAVCPVAQAQCDSTSGRAFDVAGQVIDARALVPLRAVVTLTSGRDTIARLGADSTGHFATTLCGGVAVVAHFQRLGYRADSLSVTLDTTRWTPIDVAMTPLRDATVLAETRVTASRPSAVEARARRAGGVYIGPDEIERLMPARVSDLLRGRRGVALEEVDGALRLVSTRGPRANITDGGARLPVRPPPTGARRDTTAANADEPSHKVTGGSESCALRVGVNGHVMPEDYRLDEVPAADVVAIEIYSGVASMPVEYSSTRRTMNCGLAMIWTRAAPGAP